MQNSLKLDPVVGSDIRVSVLNESEHEEGKKGELYIDGLFKFR